MRIVLFLIAILVTTTSTYADDNRKFTHAHSEETQELEKDIAYFFGANEPDLIAQYYRQAIHILEKSEHKLSKNKLQKMMLPLLEDAYHEIKEQTSLEFNVKKAALYDFNLILAQSEQKPFEDIYTIMLNLYQEVFQTKDPAIQKAAMLRTFLYKYKIQLLLNKQLSDEDIDLLKVIAERSTDELNKLS